MYRMTFAWSALVASLVLAGCGADQAADEQGAAAVTDDDAPSANVASLVETADVKRGQTLFLQCRACHSLEADGANKVGPNLHGMFGREAGKVPGFAYSEAITSSGVVWDIEAVDSWLARPSEFLPGNRMVFVGINKPQDRANLIAYLLQETGAAQ